MDLGSNDTVLGKGTKIGTVINQEKNSETGIRNKN